MPYWKPSHGVAFPPKAFANAYRRPTFSDHGTSLARTPPAACGLPLDAGQNAIEDARNRGHFHRPHFAQIAEQLVGIVTDEVTQLRKQINVDHGVLVDVRIRKNREHVAARFHPLEPARERDLRVEREIVVREHDAFGRTGRPRRVDQHGEIVGQQRRLVRTGKLWVRCANLGSARFEVGEPVRTGGLESDDARKRHAGFSQVVGSSLRVDEDEPRTGMLEDVRRVIERLRRIDRHDHATGKKRRKIADDPIDAVVRDQCHAVARDEARIADRTSNVLDSFEQSLARNRRPRFVDALDEHIVARLCERPPN